MDPKNIERAALYTLIIILTAALIAGGAALVVHFSKSSGEDTGGGSGTQTQRRDPDATREPDESTAPIETDGTTEPKGTDAVTEPDTDVPITPVRVTTYNEPKKMYALYNANARESYTTESVIIDMFYMGDEVTVTGEADNGWYQVKCGTRTAYIRGDLLTDDKSKTEPTIKVYTVPKTMYTTGNINLRESYTTKSEILDTIPEGTAVTVTGETDNNWYQVEYGDKKGFIKSDLLSNTKPAETTAGAEG